MVIRDYNRGLDPAARRSVVLLGLLSSVGLFLVRTGIDEAWPGFDSPALLTALYTLLTAVPIMCALLLEQAHDRLPLIAGVGAALVLTPLAVHTGHSTVPGLETGNGTTYFHYGLAVALACFIATPYLQARRRAPTPLHYPALYEYAWGNALSLAIAHVFTCAAWLILVLWQALFALIGIKWFSALFQQPAFIYWATGLFAGIGLMLGRTQAGAVRTLLNICLTLGRGLFPLAAAVCLLFLAALAFNHLQPLWTTHYAGSLLLALVFTAVALFNSVYQDGEPAQTYPPPLQWLSAACLAVLPVFTGIAAYGLALRVQEHGWTEERLRATMVTAFATLYALGYAISSLRARGGLPAIGQTNAIIALAGVMAMLLTQSPLLDFRRIAVHSQVAHALAPGGDPTQLDLHYLRFGAGRAGNDALLALRNDPRVAGDSRFIADVDAMLLRTNPYDFNEIHAPVTASAFTVLPAGTAVPYDLIQAINRQENEIGRCAAHPGQCLLVQADLLTSGEPTWILIPFAAAWNSPVYVQEAMGWRIKGRLRSDGRTPQDLPAAFGNQPFRTQPSPWKDLVLGDGTRFHVIEQAAP